MTVKAAFFPIAALLLVVSLRGPAAEADTRASASAPGIQINGTQISGSHISGAVGGGQASAEAVIGGGDGVIVIQGDRVVVEGAGSA